MKIAITSKGKLGSRLMNLGVEPLSCDVTVREQVEAELHRVKPDVIINTASMSGIDDCERDLEKAISVNFYGAQIVCEVAERVIGPGRVVIISTDQVFDGKSGPYFETDEPAPVNNYGLTKVGAEAVAKLYDAKVVRISRCFDASSVDIQGYLQRLENNLEIEVPNFLERSYCHSEFLAQSFMEYAGRFFEMPKILHLGGWQTTSFFNFVCAVAEEYGYDLDLISARGERDGFTPRPHRCGLKVELATALNIPVYSIIESIERMKNEEVHV